MVGVPWLTVSRKMPTRYDNRIALDRLFMDDGGMARRTTLPLAALRECLDMLTMAHDETDFIDRRGQISRGDLGHT